MTSPEAKLQRWAQESGLAISSSLDQHELSDCESSPDSSPAASPNGTPISSPKKSSKDKGNAPPSSWEQGSLEDSLDNLGVAKCARCGLRLPLESEALEQHSAQCLGNRVFTTTCIVMQDSQESPPKPPKVQSLKGGALEAFAGPECFDLETNEPEEQDVSGLFCEDALDLFVARCSRCMARFPVDGDAFERHSEECSGPKLDLEDFLAGTPAALDGKPPPLFEFVKESSVGGARCSE